MEIAEDPLTPRDGTPDFRSVPTPTFRRPWTPTGGHWGHDKPTGCTVLHDVEVLEADEAVGAGQVHFKFEREIRSSFLSRPEVHHHRHRSRRRSHDVARPVVGFTRWHLQVNAFPAPVRSRPQIWVTTVVASTGGNKCRFVSIDERTDEIHDGRELAGDERLQSVFAVHLIGIGEITTASLGVPGPSCMRSTRPVSSKNSLVIARGTGLHDLIVSKEVGSTVGRMLENEQTAASSPDDATIHQPQRTAHRDQRSNTGTALSSSPINSASMKPQSSGISST